MEKVVKGVAKKNGKKPLPHPPGRVSRLGASEPVPPAALAMDTFVVYKAIMRLRLRRVKRIPRPFPQMTQAWPNRAS
jgi:hypothetical protein